MSTPRRWVTTEPTTVGAILASMRESDDAVRDGRVFVGRRRARSVDDSVRVNEELVVHPPRTTPKLPSPFVLHDRDGILAVDKPAGIPTIPDLEGSAGSLIELAARAVNRPVEDLHPTSRLDREVSGVVTFAIGREAADALAEARSKHRYARRYLAIAGGALDADRATWTWEIQRRKALVPAESRVTVVRRSQSGPWLLLALAPITGRTHQLRIHASRAGAPLLGDGQYGGAKRLTSATGAVRTLDRIALHCANVEVELERPERCMLSVSSPVPLELRELAKLTGLAADGDPFEEALRCEV